MSVSGRWDKSAFSVVLQRVPAGATPAETPLGLKAESGLRFPEQGMVS